MPQIHGFRRTELIFKDVEASMVKRCLSRTLLLPQGVRRMEPPRPWGLHGGWGKRVGGGPA